MDYEKKYREAVKKAEAFYYSATTKPITEREVLANIFPELQESEDERIRKAIIESLPKYGYLPQTSIKVEDAIVWIEKQGTSYTKMDVDDAYLKGISDAKNEIEKQYESNYQIRKDIATFIFNYRGDIKDRAKWMNYLGIKVSLVEKQGKQKDFAPKSQRMVPAEATEATYTTEVETGDGGIKALVTGKVVMPKFKVGDWIANDYCMGKVIELTDDAYLLDTGQGIPFSYEHNAHLWTIADAKDGDVLQLGVVTAIFEKFIGNGCCKCYCSVCNGEFEIPNQDGADNSYGCHNATPATKEQRNLLFQKMKEAGYEWDAEKLELIKVPKTKESEGALKKLLDEQDKFYKEAKIVLEDKDTALAFLRRTGIIDEYGELAEKYRSDQTPATIIIAVNGTCSTAISDGNTSVTSKEVERHYCTGQYEPDVREFPIEWKEENVDELSEFERAMMHIGGSFFGENAGLNPNSTDDVKEQAELLLSLVPKQEWSEEDERMRQYVVNDLRVVKELVNDPNYAVSVESVEKEIDWMKSLKDSYTWKPSDEQMEAMHKALVDLCGKDEHNIITGLYYNLKKIKG